MSPARQAKGVRLPKGYVLLTAEEGVGSLMMDQPSYDAALAKGWSHEQIVETVSRHVTRELRQQFRDAQVAYRRELGIPIDP